LQKSKAAIRERESWYAKIVVEEDGFNPDTWGSTHLVQKMTIEGRHDEQEEEEEEALDYAVSSRFFLGNELLSELSAQRRHSSSLGASSPTKQTATRIFLLPASVTKTDDHDG
jgi:endonuclease/exonuclease/phosphatase family metal-dependent hydrolase